MRGRGHHLVGSDGPGRRLHLRVARLGASVGDGVADTAAEQVRLLRDDAQSAPVVRQVEFAQVVAVDADGSGGRIVEAGEWASVSSGRSEVDSGDRKRAERARSSAGVPMSVIRPPSISATWSASSRVDSRGATMRRPARNREGENPRRTPGDGPPRRRPPGASPGAGRHYIGMSCTCYSRRTRDRGGPPPARPWRTRPPGRRSVVSRTRAVEHELNRAARPRTTRRTTARRRTPRTAPAQ